MTEDSQPHSDPSPSNDPSNPAPRKRRRRRRGKPKPAGDSRPSPSASQSESAPVDEPSTEVSAGYRGKDKPKKPRRGQDEARSQPTGGRESNGKSRDRQQTARADSSNPQNGRGGQKPKPKKRRKPRTKQCVHCYTPCTTIHRVKLDYRRQWAFICDICWPTRCIDNPHYEYGGLWVTGRVMKPESGDER